MSGVVCGKFKVPPKKKVNTVATNIGQPAWRLLRLGGQGSGVRFSAESEGFCMHHSIYTDCAAQTVSYPVGTGALYPAVKVPTAHLHTMPRFICGAVLPPSCVFMASCLIQYWEIFPLYLLYYYYY
jgi:hypothetical protein